MGIESDAQNDLSLSDGAAEEVVGGKKKAKAKAKAKAPAHKTQVASNYTNVAMNVTPQPYDRPDDYCPPDDPGMADSTAAADDTSAG